MKVALILSAAVIGFGALVYGIERLEARMNREIEAEHQRHKDALRNLGDSVR